MYTFCVNNNGGGLAGGGGCSGVCGLKGLVEDGGLFGLFGAGVSFGLVERTGLLDLVGL